MQRNFIGLFEIQNIFKEQKYMAEIHSRILGKVDVTNKPVITFESRILGFEEYSEFYLLDMDDDSTFQILQSKDNKDICFILIDPFTIFGDYSPNIHDDDIKRLEIKEPSELLLLTIVTIPNDDYSTMTANLLGPLVFNIKTNKAMQCVVQDDKYTTRHLILTAQS